MSVRARAEAADPSAAEPSDDGEMATGPPDAAGRLLGRLSVLPTLLVIAWLLAGLRVALHDQDRPQNRQGGMPPGRRASRGRRAPRGGR